MGFSEFLNVVEIINDKGKLLITLKTLQTFLVYYVVFGALEWVDIKLALMLNPSLTVNNLDLQIMLVTGSLLLIMYLILRYAIRELAERKLKPLKEGGFREVIDEILNMIEESIEKGKTNYEEEIIEKWIGMFHSISIFGWINGLRKEFEKYLLPFSGLYGVLYYFSSTGILSTKVGKYILSPSKATLPAFGVYIFVTTIISVLKIDLRTSYNLAERQYGRGSARLYLAYVLILISYFLIPHSFFNFIAEDIGATKPSEKESVLRYKPKGKNKAPSGEFVTFVKQLIKKYDVRPITDIWHKIENPEEIFRSMEYMRATLPTPTTVAILKNTYVLIHRPEEREDKPTMSVVTFVLERTPIETVPGRKTKYSYVVHIKEIFVGASLTEPIINNLSLEREKREDNRNNIAGIGKEGMRDNQNSLKEQIRTNLKKIEVIRNKYPAIIISMIPGENKWYMCDISIPTKIGDNVPHLTETEKEQIYTVIMRVVRGFTAPKFDFVAFTQLQVVPKHTLRENVIHGDVPTKGIRIKDLSFVGNGDNQVRIFVEKLVTRIVKALNSNKPAQEAISKLPKSICLYLIIKNVKE